MKSDKDMARTVLGFVTGGVAFALLFVSWVYSEIHTAIYALGGLLVVLLAVLAWLNQKSLREAMKTRSARYGANAAITVGLVLAIIVVINFLNYNHYYRKDLTKDQTHSLSEQTIKVLKGLKGPIQFTAFVKAQARDQVKDVFDNYAYYGGSNIKVEYVDPDRDPTRAKAANVKKYGTVIIEANKKETRVEEPTEEKLTNGMLKVLKDKGVTVCFLTGHGEKSSESSDGEGYSQVKQELASQSYETKVVNLLEETKIPESCSVLLVLGPTKAFFEKEVSVLRGYLDHGGRALFAIDPNLKPGGGPSAPELKALLADWAVKISHNLVIDPTSRLLGVNASVPIIALYNKEHVITREFQLTTLFPLASTVELSDSNLPPNLKTYWLARSTPKAFAKSDFKEIATGQVRLDEKKDQAGPHTVMVAVEGNRKKERREDDKPGKSHAGDTKLIVMSSSQMAMNAYARHGANIDLFLNAVSWLADDENLISIRPKEAQDDAPTLSQTEGRYIQLITMILVPGGVLLLGLFVWWRRRSQ